jgi:hypothetical protein
MLYNRCTGIYKFGNNTYPRRIRRSSNLGHIFQEKSASYGPGNTVTGEWIKLHNEEVHVVYPSPNVIKVIKFQRMRWANHGQSDSNASYFSFCSIYKLDMWTLHYFMAEGIDVFHCSLYLCQKFSSSTQPPLKWVPDLFHWGQAARVWHWPPTPF